MKCLHPVVIRNPNYGTAKEIFGQLYIEVPCGKCFNCQSNRRSRWSFRLWCEVLDAKSSIFVTLTYDDEHLPSDNQLHVEDLQTFFKRLRKNYKLVDDRKIKYFACGEYGSHTFRPHYHALIFGLPIPSTLKFVDYWYRAILKTWQNGNISCSSVNGSRIGYMTKYILKDSASNDFYKINNIKPPFMVCSRRPSIGLSYLEDIDIDRLLEGNLKVRKMTQSVIIPEYYRRKLPENVQQRLKFLIRAFVNRQNFDLNQYYLDTGRAKVDYDSEVILEKRKFKRFKQTTL